MGVGAAMITGGLAVRAAVAAAAESTSLLLISVVTDEEDNEEVTESRCRSNDTSSPKSSLLT